MHNLKMFQNGWGPQGIVVAALVFMGCSPTTTQKETTLDLTSETALADYLMALDLGTINFPTSGSDTAQPYFVQGVAALHNFDYDDAAILFRAAQRVDPDFAMAYWGEAMTHTAVVWRRYPGGQQHRDKALSVLARLGPTPEARAAKAPTEREKGFLAAVEALYLGTADKRTRDFAHLDAMRQLSKRYPDDEEALAFYCVSRLSTERDQPGRRGTAAVAFELLVRNPEHPGSFRCLIHSVDNSERAPFGMVAARRYREVAPDTHAAHHMPAHIFIQLGKWEEATETSQQAFALSKERLAIRGLSMAEVDDHQYGHLVDYLQYSLLQGGRYEEAKALSAQVRTDYEAMGKARALQVKVASTHARYLIETAQWSEVEALIELARRDRFADMPSVLLAVGLGAVQNENLDLAKEALAGLRTIDAEVMERQVSALLFLAEGNAGEALRLLNEAATITHATDLPLGPADPIKPTLELYGEVLLMLNRPQDAIEQFEAALVRRPRRPASLVGAARASALIGDSSTASRYYAKLIKMWSAADLDHPWLTEAKQNVTP
jgi:tetratricopeptide (TPR) repeat protein